MTVLDHRTDHARPAVLGPGPFRLLDGAEDGRRVALALHRGLHPVPAVLGHRDLVELTATVRLLGRGGAAFPVARKLEATPVGPTTHVVVNGSESEPASLKDRTLMRTVPHLVLDGALVVAAALGTGRVTITVHDEDSRDSLVLARRERPDASAVAIDRSDAGFVGGEARAVVERLSGRPAVPAGRRVLPSDHGVDGRPTFVSNVETFTQIGWLASHGPQAFLEVGTADEPGTTLVTLVGGPCPVVAEVPHGTRVSDLTGRAGAPVLLGGYHGTWTRDDVAIDRAALRRAGLPWGAGVVAILPETTCAWGEVARVTRWLADQSAGQCGPCAFGLPSVADDVERLHRGDGSVLDRLPRRLGLVAGRGACAHPDGASRFVATALDVLRDEVHEHAVHGGCGRPTLGSLPLGSAR